MECTIGTGDLLRLEGGLQGVKLHCLKGTIWLTKGDAADYLVRQGQEFQLAPGASALVEALSPAEIRLEAAACQRAGVRPVLILEACHACN
jgi:hypothetical protein